MIFITGDIHASIDITKLNTKKFPEQKGLTKSDYLIIAGDFGLIWDNTKEELYWRKWLENKSFTTLFIDGNHENFDLLESYPVSEWNGGKVHRISDSIIHLMRGQVFTIEDQKLFTFGGASSHDKFRREEGISWWKQELPNEDEMNEGIVNLENHNWKVDFVITHTCSLKTLTLLESTLQHSYEPDLMNYYLDRIEEKIDFKKWYFGHFHEELTLPDNKTLIYKSVQLLHGEK